MRKIEIISEHETAITVFMENGVEAGRACFNDGWDYAAAVNMWLMERETWERVSNTFKDSIPS